MIKTALVAMTIVGCDCDARLCEYIGETPARWSTVADCEAAMKSQMLRQSNFDYPLVSGICRSTQTPAPQSAAAPADAGGDGASSIASAQRMSSEETGSIRRPTVDVGPPAAAAESIDRGPRVYEAVIDGGRAVLYRTENGYALARTGLGRAASETVSLARRSAGWVADKVPSAF